jgi:hypothetical protein
MKLYQTLDRRHKLFGQFKYKLHLSRFHRFTTKDIKSLRDFVGSDALINWCREQFGQDRTMVHNPIANVPGACRVTWDHSTRWKVVTAPHQSKHLYFRDEEDLLFFLLKWTPTT